MTDWGAIQSIYFMKMVTVAEQSSYIRNIVAVAVQSTYYSKDGSRVYNPLL